MEFVAMISVVLVIGGSLLYVSYKETKDKQK